MSSVEQFKGGEQLFDTYGPEFFRKSIDERHKLLSSHYFFDCSCEGCEENFPLLRELPARGLDTRSIIKLLDRLNPDTDYDPERARAEIKVLSQFLNDHSNSYPCYEMIVSQENYLAYAEMMYNPLPLELQIVPISRDIN